MVVVLLEGCFTSSNHIPIRSGKSPARHSSLLLMPKPIHKTIVFVCKPIALGINAVSEVLAVWVSVAFFYCLDADTISQDFDIGEKICL